MSRPIALRIGRIGGRIGAQLAVVGRTPRRVAGHVDLGGVEEVGAKVRDGG